MPSKSKTTFECSECGTQYVRWQGQCDQCSEWNTLEPIAVVLSKKSLTDIAFEFKVTKLNDVKEPAAVRFPSGFNELDRVLGDGWVHGSVNLVCGEPGIGKSTLVLQSLLSCAETKQKTLYFKPAPSSPSRRLSTETICSAAPCRPSCPI